MFVALRSAKSSLAPDFDRATLVKKAFEDMASGHFTMRDVIRRATEADLRTRRDRVLSPQTVGNMLRNGIYIGLIDSPECGVTARGDFEPLIAESTFYRAQAVLEGRVPVVAPRQRNHPDFARRDVSTIQVRTTTRGREMASPADSPCLYRRLRGQFRRAA